jgi:predicted MFS family arabinose efflux permease
MATPDRQPIRELRRFLLLVTLGWVAEFVLLPVLPLEVLRRGGSAATVGVVALAYAVPTLLLRPTVGRTIDRRGLRGIQNAGSLGFLLIPLVYLTPGIPPIVFGRCAQGASWSMYGTSTNVLMAVLAPAGSRATLSGYVSACRAVALLVAPPLGLWAYSMHLAVAVAAAVVVGAAATAVSLTWTETGVRTLGVEDRPAVRGVARFIEPSALVPMLMLSMFVSSQMLFLHFAPVYVREHDLSLDVLTAFYVQFGVVSIVAPIICGRVADRIGPTRATEIASAVAIAGLAIASLPISAGVAFMCGAVLVSAASAMGTSSIAAEAIARTPAGRIGSAMATYSMGFQLAAGVGGLMWGALISTLGFPWPFLAAIVLQLGTILMTRAAAPAT